MNMVKLKMRGIYKSFLSFIVFLLILVVSIGILYLFYDKVVDVDSDIEVTGNLSINYIDGKKIDVLKDETIQFSISNSGDKISYYNIGFLKVRGEGTYKLKYEDSIIMEGELKSIDEISTNYISIDSGETKVYSLEMHNDGITNLTSILNIRAQEGKITTFADTILTNNSPSELSLTKIGVESAVEDEGLIKSYDDIGVSYYFRGNVLNNYVHFAELTWRIVRINGDGTVRLVLDDVADSLAAYYTADVTEFNYIGSSLDEYLESWSNIYLKNYTDLIANTKFCNDVTHDDSYNFNSYVRIMTNKIPTFNCLGETFSTNIGTLTIDEVILAGASTMYSNQNYYLYNTNITDVWYTMSGAKGSESSINMFMVDANGNVKTDVNGNLYRGVRPVINLIKNIEMKGTGTITDPYRIGE